MASVFLNYTNDVFIKNVDFKTPFGLAALEGIWSDSSSTIITGVGVETAEIIQYFVGFDDLITYLHFGKGLGSISLQGIMFSDCRGDIPGVSTFYQTIGPLRGNTATLSLGGYGFTGVLSNTTVALTSEPDTMAMFSVNMAMISHTLANRSGDVGTGAASFGLGGQTL